MDEKYVDQFVTDVFNTVQQLKTKGVAESDDAILKASIKIVDGVHKENGLPGLVKQAVGTDIERQIETNCIKSPGNEGPDVYLYTCYPKGDHPKSNTGGFTTDQLSEFAKVHHGLPVYISHETRDLDPVGFTVAGGINKSGQLMGGFVLFNTPLGKLAHEWIEKMGVRGVSLGATHKMQMVDGVPVYTHAIPEEVSICYLGDQDDTWIKYKMPWSERSKGPGAQLIEMGPVLDI